MRKQKNKKVVIAMSGGVDSSAAAALLKRAGVDDLRSSSRFANARVFDVIGVFMKFWSEPRSGSTLIHADNNADLRRYRDYQGRSTPPGLQGWHFDNLLKDKIKPLKRPYFSITK